jgi:photosynthetic reaction center cytochrome c subunit
MRLLSAAAVTIGISFGALQAQDAPAKKAPPAPKNLKLLQPSDIRPMMAAFRTALGVQCTFCHVQGSFDSDDNPKKAVARNMIVMMREINAKFPDGKVHVTCYTCHRGQTEPVTEAPPAAAPAQ